MRTKKTKQKPDKAYAIRVLETTIPHLEVGKWGWIVVHHDELYGLLFESGQFYSAHLFETKTEAKAAIVEWVACWPPSEAEYWSAKLEIVVISPDEVFGPRKTVSAGKKVRRA